RPAGALRDGDILLVWTTTPWTLVSNAAVAVDPELVYARTDAGYVLAEALVARVLGEDATVVDRFPGAEMLGAAYEPPFGFIPASEYGEKGHTVLPGDFVTADDGTGIVHTAIAFGEDDYRLGQEQGLAVVNPVKLDGTYDERIGPYAGRWVKEADPDLVEDLRERGRLLRSETYLHAYPHCWRCGTPLLYYAKPSWYIGTSKLRDRLLAANETVDWHPDHIKHGRFGRWLENNVDWAISRERYWGTPLPVWRCENGHAECMGSLAELAERSGETLEDPHRPFVDAPSWSCADCGEPMRRVPEVIDVWFDSGCMPFAQHHAPFENQELFEQRFPADYICEAIDQTRGWFYSLIAVSTLLFDRAPYRTVLCLGHIADPEGKKMSKSLGNIVVPWEVIDRHGADAFRWYFLTSKQPWDGYLFSTETVGESVRQFLLQLWNTYGFYVLYANVNDVAGRAGPETDLDRWALSRLEATVAEVRERLDDYDATRAGHAIAAFVDDLSNWYVRRSRRRFWDGDPAAFGTLHTCLVTVSKLLAPFTPFIADEIYDNLDGAEPSVHLCDFPEAGERDEALEFDMGVARETVGLGLSARSQSKLKVRQPLRAAVVVAADRERAALERLGDVVREELNVKEIRYVEQAEDLGSYEIKPNYRSLGPRFGKLMPQVAAAIESLDPAHVAAAVRSGTRVGVSVDGHDHDLGPDDLQLAMKPLDGYQLEREGSHAVALELQLDDELRREGLAREVVHAVQNARKDAGLEVEDRIELRLGGDDELLAAARAHEGYLSGETLAQTVDYGDGADGSAAATIDGLELRIAVARA
ncbi:MAG: isoleucyl-tRNA synthetase, partial [Solirubrobacteraceae bacterium]|nr:isoleucyl-tRNA synthetase [Solirubrobacteraceae bacterium]